MPATPFRTKASVAAAERLLDLAGRARPDDFVLVLLSGGASALACAPGEGLTLARKQAITRALLRSGAAIGEINCVRRHLSRIKGGRLRATLTLAIADTVGGRPEDIGSGPTVADPTTIADAQGDPRPPRPRRAARRDARSSAGGIPHRRERGRRHGRGGEGGRTARLPAGHPRRMRRRGARDRPRPRPDRARFAAGHGPHLGRRADRHRDRQGPRRPQSRICARRRRACGISSASPRTRTASTAPAARPAPFSTSDAEGAAAALAANDSAAWFAARDALFVTGPTGTNVSDLRIILAQYGRPGY